MKKDLLKFLSDNKNERIFLKLYPKESTFPDDKTEESNICEVRFTNSLADKFTEFNQISEMYYDKMVNKFDYRIKTKK